MIDWIDVKTQLPKPGQRVLVFDKWDNKQPFFARRLLGGDWSDDTAKRIPAKCIHYWAVVVAPGETQ